MNIRTLQKAPAPVKRPAVSLACLAVAILVCGSMLPANADGPTTNGHYYLGGTYIEVGVHAWGYYGATDPAPAGFHPMGGRTNLGYVSDYGRDGWTVGTPPQSGDYFLPGSPEQGFTVQVDGTNYSNNGDGPREIPPSGLVETSSGPLKRTVWTGAIAGITVQRTTYFDVNASYFTTRVRLTNSSGSAKTLKYLENTDPDQGEDIGLGFSTYNWVDKQPGYGGNVDDAWVYGEVHSTGGPIILGLGTKDSRAKVYHGGFYNRDPDVILTANQAPNPGSKVYADEAIALAYGFGTVANGAYVDFEFYYVFLTGINITNLSVTPPATTDIVAGTSQDITYVVTSLDLVDVSATLSASADVAGWTATVISPPSPVVIAAGASQLVVVRVTAPAGALLGSSSNVTLTATSTKGAASDFCRMVVSALGAIACSNWNTEVGIWTSSPCGDVTSTALIATYESESYSGYADFAYEVTFVATRPQQPTAANALFVRGTPTPRGQAQVWDSGYAFAITTTGKFSIFRFAGGSPVPIQSWVTPVLPAIINGSGLANTLKVEASGGTMTFSINGEPVKTITGQPALPGTKVGVGMVRSIPTTGTLDDTLILSSATVVPPSPPPSPTVFSSAKKKVNAAGSDAAVNTAKRVSAAQEIENEVANIRNPSSSPFFDGP